MKITILNLTLIISLLILVTSCSTYTYKDMNIDENLWLFANDILANPAKLNNIKEYYPELINDTLLYNDMKDSTKINELINGILDFNKLDYNVKYFIQGFYDNNLIYYRTLKQYEKITVQDLTGFGFQKENELISFVFIKDTKKYYLFYITKGLMN